MARTLYCRHPKCGDTVDIVAGQFPAICPHCHLDAMWSTTPGNSHKERRKNPRVPFDLTLNDKRFLRSLRIQTEEPPPNNDDQADGA
jgi:hypothetical protein